MKLAWRQNKGVKGLLMILNSIVLHNLHGNTRKNVLQRDAWKVGIIIKSGKFKFDEKCNT